MSLRLNLQDGKMQLKFNNYNPFFLFLRIIYYLKVTYDTYRIDEITAEIIVIIASSFFENTLALKLMKFLQKLST